MKAHKTTQLTIAALIALATAAACDRAHAQGRAMAADPPPVEPTGLFTVPAGRVVKSLDLDLVVGGDLLSDSNVSTGQAVFGLGGIAQVEMGTVPLTHVIGGARRVRGAANGGLKVFLPIGGYWRGVAASFHRSESLATVWNDTRYRMRVGRFSAVTTLANFPNAHEGERLTGGWRGVKLKAHLGMAYVDPRLAVDGRKFSAGFWRPFGGFEMWRKNSRSRIMAEWNWDAAFRGAGAIDPIWSVTGGVRFFVSKHIAADMGVRYQSDYESISESVLHAKLLLALPTHLIQRRIVGR